MKQKSRKVTDNPKIDHLIKKALVASGEKPLGMDASQWTKLWMEIIGNHPDVPTDEGAMLGWLPTSADIREIVAGLKTLADTFPAVIHAANGPRLHGDPMHTMGVIDRAVDALLRHSYDLADRETEKQKLRTDETVKAMIDDRATAYERGRQTGESMEKIRAEKAAARKPHKAKAAK